MNKIVVIIIIGIVLLLLLALALGLDLGFESVISNAGNTPPPSGPGGIP
jgi:hypothetical protein